LTYAFLFGDGQGGAAMGTTIKSIAVIVVLFASASSASAQLPTTTILGTVRDSGAGVMPGVTLTVTNAGATPRVT
jgi:hypothetical protein